MNLGAVSAVASVVSIVAVLLSVFPKPRLLIALYGLVVAFVTIGDFFRGQLLGAVPFAWAMTALFGACDTVLTVSKLVEPDEPAPKGESRALPLQAPVRVLCGVPMVSLGRRCGKELGAQLVRVAPIMASVYASMLGWCMVMVLWVGSLAGASSATNLRVVSDLTVASLAMVVSCATFELSVRMDRLGAEHGPAARNSSCVGRVARHLLMHPVIAWAMTIIGVTVAVVVLPTELAVAYALVVVALPAGVLAVDVKRLRSFCRKPRKRNVAYLWDVRMSAECAWWATIMAVETAHVPVLPATLRLDAATLSLSVVALMSAVVAVGVALTRTVPELLRRASISDGDAASQSAEDA